LIRKKTNHQLYIDDNPLLQIPFEKKVKLLQDIDAYARSKDPRVKQVSIALSASWKAIQILRAGGQKCADIRPLVRMNVSVYVEDASGRMEDGYHGMGGRYTYDRIFDEKNWKDAVDEAYRQALVNLESVAAPAGEMCVVLGNGWPGILLHEAIGHGLEGDFNRKETSAFSGLIGQQVASKGVTVVDDGTLPDRRGSITIDDEGTPSQRNVLIEDGILVGYLQDRMKRASDGWEIHRQRQARILRRPYHAAHDEYGHAERQPCAGRNFEIRQKRPLCRQLRRRPGGYYFRQVRFLGFRGLYDRGRKNRPPGQRRYADRQRPGCPDQSQNDR
jgi:hypothetical protein